MTFSAGIETKIAAIPKAISPSSAQRGRVGPRVVGDERGDREAEQETEPGQESDRELLAALGGGDVECDDDWDRGDGQHEPDGAVQIAAEVGAERGEPDRDRERCNAWVGHHHHGNGKSARAITLIQSSAFHKVLSRGWLLRRRGCVADWRM